jgi:hypothetical protein
MYCILRVNHNAAGKVSSHAYCASGLTRPRFAHASTVISNSVTDISIHASFRKEGKGCHRRTQVPMMPIVVKQAELIAEYRSCIQC